MNWKEAYPHMLQLLINIPKTGRAFRKFLETYPGIQRPNFDQRCSALRQGARDAALLRQEQDAAARSKSTTEAQKLNLKDIWRKTDEKRKLVGKFHLSDNDVEAFCLWGDTLLDRKEETLAAANEKSTLAEEELVKDKKVFGILERTVQKRERGGRMPLPDDNDEALDLSFASSSSSRSEKRWVRVSDLVGGYEVDDELENPMTLSKRLSRTRTPASQALIET